MRSYIVAASALAIASSAANAANCNPTYNVPSAGTCIANCNSNAAKAFDSEWTNDPTSEHFIDSLALMCDKPKSGSLYTAFMSQAGMCMAACTADEQAAFFTEYDGACAWYNAHVNDTCTDSSSSSSSSSNSSASGSTPSSTVSSPSGSSSGSSSSGSSSSGSSSSGSSDSTSSTNNQADASTNAAGKLEFGAITAAAVAFAAFIAL